MKIMCPSGETYLCADCCCCDLAQLKFNLRVDLEPIRNISSLNVTCSRHDAADKLLIGPLQFNYVVGVSAHIGFEAFSRKKKKNK